MNYYRENELFSILNNDPSFLVQVKNSEYPQTNTEYINSGNNIISSQCHGETFEKGICSINFFSDEMREKNFQDEDQKDNQELNNAKINDSSNLKEGSSVTEIKCRVVDEKDATMNQTEHATEIINCTKKFLLKENLSIKEVHVHTFNELKETEFKVILNDVEVSEPLSSDFNNQIFLKVDDDNRYIKLKYNFQEFKNIYRDSTLFPIFYSYSIPIFHEINLKVNKPFKYILINRSSKEFCLNLKISGTIYFKNIDNMRPFDMFIFLENITYNNYDILLSELLKTRFPIFNFSIRSKGKRITLKKTILTPIQTKISLEEYFMKFKEISDLFLLTYKSRKYNDVDQIPIINYTRTKDLPFDSWKGAVFLISKFTVELIKNIEKLKKFFENPLNDELEINKWNIGIIIENILLKKSTDWCIVYPHCRNKWLYEEDMIISFYIYYHREIYPVLEHLRKYNFTNNIPKYIERQNLQITHR